MKPIALYSIIGGSALLLGSAGGIIYKRVIMPPVQNLVGFNEEVCKPDGEALINDIESVGDFKAAVNKFSPVDIANYATEKYKTYENSVSYCYGVADTIVTQAIRNAQIKNGNKYFEEAISKSSMVGVGKRMYQDGVDGKLNLYHEKSASDVTIDGDYVHTNFKDNHDTLTPDEYKNLYGRKLPDMFIYLVHQITVTNSKIDSLPGGGYKVSLELDPLMGGYNYRFQMKTISSLDSFPSFEFIKLTYTLDDTLNLKHITANEKYQATMGMTVSIENTLEYEFFPNILWKIPEVNEDLSYSSLKGIRK